MLYFMSVNIWAVKLKDGNYFMEVLWLYIGLGFVVILPNRVYRAQSRAEPAVHTITVTWKLCEDILSHPPV
jgi:hypothetical protein